MCQVSHLLKKLADQKQVEKVDFIGHDEVSEKLKDTPELHSWLVALHQREKEIGEKPSGEELKTVLLTLWVDQLVVNFSRNSMSFPVSVFFD